MLAASRSLYAAGLVSQSGALARSLRTKGLMNTVAGNGPKTVVHHADVGKGSNNALSGSGVDSDEANSEINSDPEGLAEA